jgi:hypothetical protein
MPASTFTRSRPRTLVEDPPASIVASSGREFLESCPDGVVAKFVATLNAVRDRPPPAFGGGGKWEAMHDEMSGYYEIRCDGPGRKHYRLFCLLERDDEKRKLGAPSLVVICE